MKKLLIVTTLALTVAGCRRTDVREFTISIPGLTPANQAEVVAALAKYQGVEQGSYRWDFAKKTLTLRYDSMTVAHTNLRMAIEEKGIAVEYPENTTGKAGH